MSRFGCVESKDETEKIVGKVLLLRAQNLNDHGLDILVQHILVQLLAAADLLRLAVFQGKAVQVFEQ